MPSNEPKDVDAFIYFALSLHAHAISFGKVCNADGADVANGLLHALCMHLALDPGKNDDTIKAFAEAIPALVDDYSKSDPLFLLRSSMEQNNEQARNDASTEPGQETRTTPAAQGGDAL